METLSRNTNSGKKCKVWKSIEIEIQFRNTKCEEFLVEITHILDSIK